MPAGRPTSAAVPIPVAHSTPTQTAAPLPARAPAVPAVPAAPPALTRPAPDPIRTRRSQNRRSSRPSARRPVSRTAPPAAASLPARTAGMNTTRGRNQPVLSRAPCALALLATRDVQSDTARKALAPEAARSASRAACPASCRTRWVAANTSITALAALADRAARTRVHELPQTRPRTPRHRFQLLRIPPETPLEHPRRRRGIIEHQLKPAPGVTRDLVEDLLRPRLRTQRIDLLKRAALTMHLRLGQLLPPAQS